MEIEEHDDHIIFLLRKFRPFLCLSFEVHRLDSEVREVPLFRRGGKLCHGLFIAVYRIDLKAVRGEIERMASRPGRNVQGSAFRQPMELSVLGITMELGQSVVADAPCGSVPLSHRPIRSSAREAGPVF